MCFAELPLATELNECMQMNTQVAKWCAVLEITGQANESTVKAAYRRQMLRWHPDRHHGDPGIYAVAEQRAKVINRAYECLTEILEEKGSLDPIDRRPGSSAKTSTAESQTEPRHVYRQRPFQPGFPDKSVFEVFVKSSNILSIGYSMGTCILYIKFRDGAIYRYFDVPQTTFDLLLNANSHGSYAHRSVYCRFRSERY